MCEIFLIGMLVVTVCITILCNVLFIEIKRDLDEIVWWLIYIILMIVLGISIVGLSNEVIHLSPTSCDFVTEDDL